MSGPRPRPRSRGRLLIAVGSAIAILGLVGYIVQLSMRQLFAPWYVPLSASFGALLPVIAFWQQRVVWRMVGLLLVGLLAGAEWTFLMGTRLPPYTGPVEVGQPFPAFTTIRADGTPFNQRDLTGGDQHTALVFFRGRW
jgi:hypothetical protein